MTPDDTRNLFEQLLSKYFQGHPRLLDPAQRTAYHEILEPYRLSLIHISSPRDS